MRALAGLLSPLLHFALESTVAGELTAAFAAAGGYDQEEVLGDIIEIMRRSGRDYHEALAEAMPVAGNKVSGVDGCALAVCSGQGR